MRTTNMTSCISGAMLDFSGKFEPCWNCTPATVSECPTCQGEGRLSMNRCSYVSAPDRAALAAMIDFTEPFKGSANGFNEGYLGIGILTGLTDYGRHLGMSEDEFKDQAVKMVNEGFLQYAAICNKEGALPEKFTVRRGRSGWFVYPKWNKQKV